MSLENIQEQLIDLEDQIAKVQRVMEQAEKDRIKHLVVNDGEDEESVEVNGDGRIKLTTALAHLNSAFSSINLAKGQIDGLLISEQLGSD